jgi:hypothetical protein
MYKRGIILGLVVVSLSLLMILSSTSAFSFSDFYGKITGNVVSEGCPSNLVVYYKLDNNVLDSSGNARTGTIIGNPTSVSGKLGTAYHFDGSAAVDVGNIDFSNQEFSISSWVRTTDPGQTNNYREWISKVGYWETGTFEFNIHAPNNGNGLAVAGWSSGRGIYGMEDRNVNLRDGNWHYVVGTYKRGSQSLYVDGVLSSSNNYAGDLPITTQTVQIGGTDWHYYHHRWVGDIDEVAIYNKALSSSEVSALYNSGNGKDVCSSNIIPPVAQNFQQCSDSDGSSEFTKGYVNVSLCQNVSGQVVSCNTSISFNTDYCLNNLTVGESICSSNNESLVPINCSSGYSCSDGRCVNGTSQSLECTNDCLANICSGNGFLPCFDVDADGCKEIGASIVPCQESTVCQNGNCIILTENPFCGNGLVEQGEQCDSGLGNGNCPNVCALNCTLNLNCISSTSLTEKISSNQPTCQGCIYNESCLPVGYRLEVIGAPSFCDVSGIKEQKKNTENITQSCQNSFECESNICSAGECVEIIGSKAIFVKLVCRLANINDEDKYLSCLEQYIYGVESISSEKQSSSVQITNTPTSSCNSDWRCGTWSLCDENNKRTRICSDWNNCGTNTGKPLDIEYCTLESSQTQTPTIVEVTQTEQGFTWWNPSTWSGFTNTN